MTICPFNRHPSDDELVEAEIAAVDGFGNANSSTQKVQSTKATNIVAQSEGNAEFIVTQTHLSFGGHLEDNITAVADDLGADLDLSGSSATIP